MKVTLPKISSTRTPFSKVAGFSYGKTRLVFLVIALLVLVATFLLGGLTYRSGIRPSSIVTFAQNQAVDLMQQFSHSDLPTLVFDMDFDNFERIRVKREEALKRGQLFASDEDFVPAELTFNNQTFPIKMRLKGDLTDHLETDKWSYRIHMKGDGRLFGLRRFSIQSPHTRAFHREQGFLYNLAYEGVLAPRYHFVNVEFNGKRKGIYALEEFVSREMIEANGRREGVLLAFDTTSYWEYYEGLNVAFWILSSPGHLGVAAPIRVYQNNRIAQNKTLSAQSEAAIDKLRGFQEGRLQASEVFDIDLMAKYLAIVDLWKAPHALDTHNIRWYYNPITTKIEPIGFDANPSPIALGESVLSARGGTVDHIRRIVDDPVILEAFIRQLDRILQPEYIGELRDAIGTDTNRSLQELRKEQPDLVSFWPGLEQNQTLLRRLLDPPLVGVAYGRLNNNYLDPSGQVQSVLNVDLANALSVPLTVIGVELDSKQSADEMNPSEIISINLVDEINGDDLMLRRRFARLEFMMSDIFVGQAVRARDFEDPLFFQTVRVSLNEDSINLLESGGSAKVLTQIPGQTKTRSIPVKMMEFGITEGQVFPKIPTLNHFLNSYNFLSLEPDNRTLMIAPGNWRVHGDLVLPQGFALRAGPGTLISFDENAILLTTGPINLHGTEENPVVLQPNGESWGGILVLNADSPSVWEHVTVRNTTGVTRPGLGVTGGVTFYRSPTFLRNVRFLGSRAEDSLNVVLSGVDIIDSQFDDAISDAFDGDSVTGTVRSSVFRRIGGDAVDIASSDIRGNNLIFQDVNDKAISVGEASRADFYDVVISDVGIGIVAKDNSIANARNVTINRAELAGIAAYQKKPEYGPARIYADDIEFVETKEVALVQKRSVMIVNSVEIPGTDINVESLYEQPESD